jgi:hypothetical protein
MSLAGALAVTFRLVGIDLAHALEEIVHIGAIDFGCGRSAAWRRGIRSTAAWPSFLILIGHKINLVPVCLSSTSIAQVSRQNYGITKFSKLTELWDDNSQDFLSFCDLKKFR